MSIFNKIGIFCVVLSFILAATCMPNRARSSLPGSSPTFPKIDQIAMLENMAKSQVPAFPFDSVFKLSIIDKDGDVSGSATAWALSSKYDSSVLHDTKLFVTAGHVCRGLDIMLLTKQIQRVELSSPLVNEKYELDNFFALDMFDTCIAFKKGQNPGKVKGFELRGDPYMSPMTRVYSIQGPYGEFPIITEGRVGGVDLNNITFTVGMNSYYGSSGSPVFDENFLVVGLVSRIYNDFTYLTINMTSSTIELTLNYFYEYQELMADMENFFEKIKKQENKIN